MVVDLRAQTEFLAYYTGEYDTRNIRSVLRLVEPHWIILDVGANIGFWSIPLARALKESGRLHCFEPVPSNFRLLTANVERNCTATTVHVHQLGLSNRSGTVQISLREDFAGGSETGNAAIVIDGDDSRFQSVQAEVRPLDDVFESLALNGLDFMKVDIEGHEHKFLAGAAQTIARFRPILFMEINDHYYERQGLDPTALFHDWLLGHSYVAAFRGTNRWQLDDLSNRRRGINDIFFFPRDKAHESMARL
ncbi:MAG TPA: FkbM family methyltransferase [Candidatus Acidoferrales bacterium]|nr:FkbM family methyltransferase [Candidatus Acidoferrales bacterium]